MSWPLPRYQCDGCDYRGITLPMPFSLVYQLGDGATIESYPALGWCFDCNSLTKIEDFGDDAFGNEFKEKRKSKPSCLKCSGTNIALVTFSDDDRSDFVHACGGTIYRSYSDNSPRYCFKTVRYNLDIEGNLLSISTGKTTK